jgi:hypothetical protein
MSDPERNKNDNVVQFPTKRTDAELWQAAADHIVDELDAFRAATDPATADRARDLMRQGPVVFDLRRHELELPAGAKGADKTNRRRQINVLGKAFREECKRAGSLRRVAGAEAAAARAVAAGGAPAEQQIIEEHAFDEVRGTFIRIASMVHLDNKSFEQEWSERLVHVLMSTKADGSPSIRPLSVWFKAQRGRGARVVEGIGVIPGAEPGAVIVAVINNRPQRLLNAWRDPVAELARDTPSVTDAMVQPMLDLVTYLFDVPDHHHPRVLPVLDWKAGIVGAPAIKPGWAPYLAGDPGTGKNLLFMPLEKAFGPGGAVRLRPADLGARYDEYLVARLCIVSELKETTPGSLTAHDIYARIKEIVDATSDWVLVNEKYERKKWVCSTTGMVLLTNNPNMLPVDARERRLGYYRIEVPPKPKAFYEDYVVPWLEHGDPIDDGPPGWQLWVKWLGQRWQAMDAGRRAAFEGNAPDTPEKRTMVAVAANPVKELLGAIVAKDFADSHDLIPDISDLNAVRAGLRRAIETGGHGADPGTRIPSNGQLGDWLRELGAEKLHYDPVERVHTQIRVGKERQRLWAIRNAQIYRQLTPMEVAAAWGTQKKALV